LAFIRECLEGRMGRLLSELSILEVGAGNGSFIHHVVHPQRAMDGMARVANAALVVSDPNRNSLLMFSLGALVPSGRGTLKFNQRFLKTLMTSPSPALERVSTRTQGIMVPNKVPGWAFPFVRTLEPFLFPRMYLPSVAEEVQAASPSE